MEKRGPIENMQSPRPKPRRSSARALALVWVGTCTASGRYGSPSLNRYGDPITTPVLPDWALRPGFSASSHGQHARGPLDQGESVFASGLGALFLSRSSPGRHTCLEWVVILDATL